MSGKDNRIIAVVTGANSGLGYGICQVLLRCLSLPPGSPIYEPAPVRTAVHPSLQHLLDDDESTQSQASSSKTSSSEAQPATLTLVLVCRSIRNAEKTRKLLLEEHEALLLSRANQGLAARKGWWEGLEIRCENCDFSEPGGDNGILSACERLKRSLPYITLLFLNAGFSPPAHVNYARMMVEVIKRGPVEAYTRPAFTTERLGMKTKDGERGLTWSINTLAPYLLTQELIDLLRKSPPNLDYAPRIIYTSSRTAEHSYLPQNVQEDYQLVQATRSYGASKYLANLVLCQLDREYGSSDSSKTRTHDDNDRRKVRCVTVDPGAVRTNVADESFRASSGGFTAYVTVMRFINLAVFWLMQNILGSPWHPGTATNSAHAMVHAALLDDRYIASPDVSPAPTFQIVARRWNRPTVGLREVDQWREREGLGREQARRCEELRVEWKRREGLE